MSILSTSQILIPITPVTEVSTSTDNQTVVIGVLAGFSSVLLILLLAVFIFIVVRHKLSKQLDDTSSGGGGGLRVYADNARKSPDNEEFLYNPIYMSNRQDILTSDNIAYDICEGTLRQVTAGNKMVYGLATDQCYRKGKMSPDTYESRQSNLYATPYVSATDVPQEESFNYVYMYARISGKDYADSNKYYTTPVTKIISKTNSTASLRHANSFLEESVDKLDAKYEL